MHVLRGLSLSLQNLAAHRLRTALSVSGLVVGVAAVVVMVAVGRGAERRVLERVRAMGTDMLVVSPATAQRVAGRQRQVETVTVLRPADADAIAVEAVHALRAAAAARRSLVVRYEGRNTTVLVEGTTPDGLAIRNVVTGTGRRFDELEERELRRVAVIGATVARVLFGEADPVGQEVRIGRVPFEVVGVARGRGVDAGGADQDNVVYIPLSTALRRVLNVPYVDAVFVQARSGRELDALEAEVLEILARRHTVRAGVASPFVVQNQAELLRTEREAARTLTRLVGAAAALALLVGAAGVLAVMMLAVRDRVREIGVRRAVGARRRDIRHQFLLEAGLLACAGGVAGVMLGTLAAGAAALVGPWELVLSWRAAVLGIVAAMLTGLAAGVLPAARAARLEPAEALRTR